LPELGEGLGVRALALVSVGFQSGLHDIARLKDTDDKFCLFCPGLLTHLRVPEDALRVLTDVFDSPLVAVVGQGCPIYLHRAITLEKQFLLSWFYEPSDAGTYDEQQIALSGS